MPLQKQPSQEPLSTGKRLALVVGNNGKPQPGRAALEYAPQSAQAIAEVLHDKCNFELLIPPILAKQATTECIKNAIYTLVENRGPDDFLLFYFCGHGEPLFIESEQRDVYLVSQDFDPKRVENLDRRAHISFSWLSDILYEKTNAGIVLIILDCCYAGNIGYQQEEQPLETLKQSIEQCFKFYLGDPTYPRYTKKSRGVRITLAATSYNSTTTEQEGYSRLVRHLLPPLKGEPCGVANNEGQITLDGLVGYLRGQFPKEEQFSISNLPIATSVVLATFANQTLQARREQQQAEKQALEEQKLRVLSRHEFSRFLLHDRLASFVGRERELNDIRQSITRLLDTGGYLAITGEAGQGKSSIIATLIDQYSTKQNETIHEEVIYHFIPFEAGVNYQIFLLKHLLACLVLKYHLPTFYAESNDLATLQSMFTAVLHEIALREKQEIIFIDGLDQLQEDLTGVRDTNLLPYTHLPKGIVFVIGTRPSALRPLKRHTPYQEYLLQPLSFDDFQGILQRRNVTLASHLIRSLYDKLNANALFLDLVAQELIKHTNIAPDQIIRLIAENPENLFSLSMNRLGRNLLAFDTPWRRVIQPVLGILLTAREPIERTHLKQIINLKHKQDNHSVIDGGELERGLERLGGLVVKDIRNGQQYYSLFHLKLGDYLRQKEAQPDKDYIFDVDDERQWHRLLAQWCEQPQLDLIWQDASYDTSEQRRRLYARQHYIMHLYYAHSLENLFHVLDEGSYGKEKVKIDLSARTYTLDLELGQKATTLSRWSQQEAIHLLPYLWRYTLLRCSLVSKADKYPKPAFQYMLLVGQETKALGLAELLTEPTYKVEILLLIASHFATLPEKEIESQQLFIRVQEIALTIQNSDTQAEAFSQLGQALAQAQRWEQAERVIQSIQHSYTQARALIYLANALAKHNEYGRLLSLLHYWWQYVKKRDEAIRLLTLSHSFISHHPELGIAFYKAFAWVDDFLQG